MKWNGFKMRRAITKTMKWNGFKMRRAITKKSYENNQENNQPGYLGIMQQNLYFSFLKKTCF